jgi:hypothetical protein
MSKLTDLTALERLDEMLTKIESTYAAERAPADGNSALAKLEATLTEIERSEDPEYIAKRAREADLAKYMAQPQPPKCMGAGAAFVMTKERIEKLAKARGYGMSEAEWKRGLA